jgi:hypothetical protein
VQLREVRLGIYGEINSTRNNVRRSGGKLRRFAFQAGGYCDLRPFSARSRFRLCSDLQGRVLIGTGGPQGMNSTGQIKAFLKARR